MKRKARFLISTCTTFFYYKYLILTSLIAFAVLTGCRPAAESEQASASDIEGIVTGPNGPEAGVWVIAETHDLPTRFAKIVVTDDQGRYLIPELPNANYDVWVRGYGLVDSPKKESKPGSVLNLEAIEAPNPRAALNIIQQAIGFHSLMYLTKATSLVLDPMEMAFHQISRRKPNF